MATDYEKSRQVHGQLIWALNHSHAEFALEKLQAISPSGWHRTTCLHNERPTTFPSYVAEDGKLLGRPEEDAGEIVGYIERSVADGICLRLKSHGCGNVAFKQGLNAICARIAGTHVGDLHHRATQHLVSALLTLRGDSNLNHELGREALRVCVYHLWTSVGPQRFEFEVAPQLQTAWVGRILGEMRAHSASGAKQRR